MSKKDKEHLEIDPAKEDKKNKKIDSKVYESELEELQIELVKLQNWAKDKSKRILIVFEGRDAAGKGGLIKIITEHLNPRGARVVALGKPSDTEMNSWYFQRYVSHLPAAGEMVLFDRSWYNRAGVERVMGFCKDEEYWEFLRECPNFEKMLIHSGIILIKYWFSATVTEKVKFHFITGRIILFLRSTISRKVHFLKLPLWTVIIL